MPYNQNKQNQSNYDEFETENEQREMGAGASMGNIVNALRRPKNLILLIAILVFVIIFVVKLVFTNSGKQDKIIVAPQVKVPEPVVRPSFQEGQTFATDVRPQAREITPPPLPSLDIDLLNGANSRQNSFQTKDDIDFIDLDTLRAELTRQQQPPELELFLENPAPPKRVRKLNPDNPPPPIITTGGGLGPVDRKSQKTVSDFLFVDSALDAEISDEVPNEGKKIADLGNIVAQGRMIDAILETAINSGIPGTIRGVVSRDVYAEAGDNILIPKGTRLYGTYSAGNLNSARIIITWSRILRPDGISVGINSFASDQFGRAGVEGSVDKKYLEIISSALLLSAIPLVSTIAVQELTGGRRSDTTQISGNIITTTSDPINNATVKFGDAVSAATSKVVKDLIDTTVVITIPQGTRIKVIINQDLKLTAYKPVTSINTTITPSSQ
jgi:hypothetical protein